MILALGMHPKRKVTMLGTKSPVIATKAAVVVSMMALLSGAILSDMLVLAPGHQTGKNNNRNMAIVSFVRLCMNI